MRKVLSALLSCVITIMFFFLGAERVDAYQTTCIRHISPVHQSGGFLCWAATSTAILNYKGYSVSQYDFVVAVHGSYIDHWINYAYQVANGINSFGANCSYQESKMSYSQVINQIYNYNRPIAAGCYLNGAKHMVAITGYSSASGQELLYYMDPWDCTLKEINYANSSSWWLNSIYNIY